jgi:hypothetical protein
MLDLLGAVSPMDVRLSVYCPDNAPWIAELRPLNPRVYDWFSLNLHKEGRSARLMAVAGFLAFLVAKRVELIHVNQAGAAPYALFAGSLLGIPVVLLSRWHEDGETIHSWTRKTSALARAVRVEDVERH